MKRCGIPPFLQGIVLQVIGKPRWVYFNATGPLEKIGESTDTINVRKILTTRGCFMGDPLTKVILHHVNMAVRKLVTEGANQDFWKDTFYNYEIVAKVFKDYC